MFSNLKQWISLDNIFEQEEDRRMARILLAVILIYGLGSLVILFMDQTWGDGSLTVPLIAGCLLQLISLGMLFKGMLSASSYVTIAIYLGFATLFATIGLGIRDYVIMMYPAVIMFAGLTHQRRGLILSLVLTMLSLAWLVFGEMYGWFIIRKVHVPNVFDLIIACLIIIVAAIAVHLLVSNLEYGLTQTWRELARRQRAEEELRKSREDFQRYFSMGTVGMAVTTPEKKWVEVNDRLCQIFGYSREELVNMTWPELTHPDDVDANLKLFDRMLVGEIDSYQMDKRYIRKDKSVVYTSLFATCHRNPDGTLNHLLTSIIDITERKLAEEALSKSEMMYRLLAENILDVIWILDLTDGKFRYVSPSVERLRGFTAEEAMAQSVDESLTPASLKYSQEKISLRIKAYQDGYRGFYVDEVEQPCKDGSIIWVEMTTALRMNETSGHIEAFGVSRNITERRHSEAISQIRLNLLEFAATASLDELMRKSLDEVTLFVDSAIGFYHFVEADQKTLALQAWSTRTLDEFCKAEGKGRHYDIDAAGVWVECVRQGRPVIHNDYASIPNRKGLPDNHAKVIRELVVPVYRSGKIVSILGVGNKPTDYTEKDAEAVSHLADVVWEIIKRKQTEQSLNEIQSRLSLLGDNLEEAALYVYSHDDKGRSHFEYLSDGMEKLTGITKEQALQDVSNLHATILPEYIPPLVELEERSKQDLKSFEMEICQKHAISGEIRWALLRSTPRRRADGSTVWYGVQIDITGRKRNEELLEEANEKLRVQVEKIEQLHEELREQAIRDPLTGLYNRRYMQDAFRQEFSRARRENYPVSVIMLDLDELKSLNDTHGHHVGDQALQALAFRLQSMTRKEDIVCRYGGDEFTVILSKTFPKDAVRRVEEWREFLKSHPLEIEGKNNVMVKFTAGVASFPDHGETLEELINYADVALYRAKAKGRDCTLVFE